MEEDGYDHGWLFGRFGVKYALGRFRLSYLEADIGDMRPANRLFELLGRDWALQLHVPSAKFPVHYLAGSQTIIPLRQ